VYVVGSINTDLVVYVERLPAGGETLFGEHFAQFAGGKGANQAVAAARAGARTAFYGAVGDDAYGRAGRASLERANLEGAMLIGAEFPGTSFRDASLRSAYFGGVALAGADLSGADLGEVRNLTQAQLDAATVDARTVLPPGLGLGESGMSAVG
jgi:sugar/nucleoside kinase (ribokinase family)